MTVHHVGYLVRSIAKAGKVFEGLGYAAEGEVTRDESRKIDILFMVNGNTRVELVAPYEDGSAVGDLRKRIGSAPYHICYETEDIEKDVAALTENGYVLTAAPAPAPAIGGKKVAFFLHPAIGIIELVEK